MLYVNLFKDGKPLLEDAAQGDSSVELDLGGAEKTVVSLLDLESFPVSVALAAVFLAGVKEGQRDGRRVWA